jgi:hypothetical protein
LFVRFESGFGGLHERLVHREVGCRVEPWFDFLQACGKDAGWALAGGEMARVAACATRYRIRGQHPSALPLKNNSGLPVRVVA